MINRDEALVILKKYLHNEDNIKYSLAVEAVIREIAKRIERDEELWGLTGLLYNIDYEYTINEPEKRGILSAQILEDLIPKLAVNAIKANNYMHTDYIPTTSLDKTLIAVDAAVGLILAISKTFPNKKISEVNLETVIEKYNDAEFATRYNRNKIQLCVDVGIDINNFFKLILNTLNQVSDVINL
jgi:predicted hydrolase (HD superfamily)